MANSVDFDVLTTKAGIGGTHPAAIRRRIEGMERTRQ